MGSNNAISVSAGDEKLMIVVVDRWDVVGW